MLQWADEIRRGTKEDTLKILVFYSSARNKYTMEDLLEADVVLTTYPVLEYEYRKIVDINKVPCKYCGKKLLPRSLVWHNKYFCGPDAVRTTKQSKTEKTAKKEATLKAMQTLKITKAGDELPETAGGTGESKKRGRVSSIATPMAIYNDLMASANRTPLNMYDKAIEGDKEGDPDGTVSADKNDAITPVKEDQGSSRSKRARKQAPEVVTDADPTGRSTRSTRSTQPTGNPSEEHMASTSQVLLTIPF